MVYLAQIGLSVNINITLINLHTFLPSKLEVATCGRVVLHVGESPVSTSGDMSDGLQCYL